jgi:hypothetical protein
MSTNWTQVKKQIKTLREYLRQTPTTKKKQHACLITIEEIERLLSQKNDGSKLDGLRIYLGAEKDGDYILPTIAAIVACEKDTGDNYHDFNVPEKNLKTLTMTGTENGALLSVGKAYPCPDWCSKSNILNAYK